jgi:hypothetical protein
MYHRIVCITNNLLFCFPFYASLHSTYTRPFEGIYPLVIMYLHTFGMRIWPPIASETFQHMNFKSSQTFLNIAQSFTWNVCIGLLSSCTNDTSVLARPPKREGGIFAYIINIHEFIWIFMAHDNVQTDAVQPLLTWYIHIYRLLFRFWRLLFHTFSVSLFGAPSRLALARTLGTCMQIYQKW